MFVYFCRVSAITHIRNDRILVIRKEVLLVIMKLKNILVGVEILKMNNFKNYNIKTITHCSSQVENLSIFIALKGNNYDGNNYIDLAIEKGAKCIITDDTKIVSDSVCVVVVKDARIAMGVVAKNFYNRCVDDMKVIGIIGTSGKTTTSLIISQLLSFNGNKVGVIGTNGIYIDNIRQDNTFTTPDPIELHYIFYQMKCLGVEIVVMEVSAQAIYYNKVYGINFDIGVFTNISREHLDFFGSMEKYAMCKMDFFNKNNMKECVVNVDDFYGRELAYKVNIPCISYGIEEPANSFAIDIELGFDYSKFVANILDDIISVNSSYVGQYNISNILASLTVAKMLGVGVDVLSNAIRQLKEIDGRYNLYNVGGKKILIDFAHTPKSISTLLSHIKETSNYNILCVFGCVGYSDRDKRIEMATAVAKYSCKVIVTTDNRGTTEFKDICLDIVEGLKDTLYMCIEDRETAIKYAYSIMEENDLLVVMGKGAENFQKIGDERIPYSDRDVVVKLLV